MGPYDKIILPGGKTVTHVPRQFTPMPPRPPAPPQQQVVNNRTRNRAPGGEAPVVQPQRAPVRPAFTPQVTQYVNNRTRGNTVRPVPMPVRAASQSPFLRGSAMQRRGAAAMPFLNVAGEAIQRVFEPLIDPKAAAERAGVTLNELTPEQKAAYQATIQAGTRGRPTGRPGAAPVATPDQVRAAQYALSTQTPAAYAFRSIPDIAINAVQQGAETVARGFGTAQQKLGIDTNPVRAITGGGAAESFIFRVIAEAARENGREDTARFIEENGLDMAEGSVAADLVANIAARARLNGKDSSRVERVLNILKPPAKDSETLIAQQTEAILRSHEPITENDVRAQQFVYAGSDVVQQARNALRAGEDWGEVQTRIKQELTLKQNARVFLGEAIFDPLNAPEFIGTVGKIEELGLTGRRLRFGQEAAGRLVLEGNADEAVRALRQYSDITSPQGVDLLTRIRTVESRQARVTEEAGLYLQTLVEGISPDAPRRLAEMGITQTPVETALKVLIDPDDFLKAGNNVDEVTEALGLGKRTLGADEAARFGREEGAVYNLFGSDAAVRTREVYGEVLARSGGTLVEEMTSVRSAFREALQTGQVVVEGADGAETVLKGEKALDYVVGELGKFTGKMDTILKEATGYAPPKNALDGFRQRWSQYQGVFAKYFHIGPNFGTGFRNIFSNTNTLIQDGVNMTMLPAGVRGEMARLGLEAAPGLNRTFGGGFDTLAQLTARGPLRELTPMALMRTGERNAGNRAFLENFKGMMQQNMQVGRMIDAEQFALLTEKFPDEMTPRLRAMVENIRTPEGLARFRAAVEGAPWRSIADGDVMRRAESAGVLPDIERILASSPTPEEAVVELGTLVDDINRYVEDVAAKASIPMGTPEGEILDDYARWLEKTGLPTDSYDAFSQMQMRWYVGKERSNAYAMESIDAMVRTDAVAAQKLERELSVAKDTADDLYNQIWGERAQVLQAIRDQDLDKLFALDPQLFGEVRSVDEAWDLYYAWVHEEFSSTRQELIGKMVDIGNRAGGTSPPNLAQLEALAPATATQQKVMFRSLVGVGHEQGMDIRSMAKVLEENGMLASDWLVASRVRDQEWYNEAVRILQEAGQDTSLAGRSVPASVIDEMLDAPAPRVGTATPGSPVTQAVVEATDRNAALREVSEHIFNRADEVAETLTPDQAAALEAFLNDLEPRLTYSRAISKQVGAAGRDFSVLNYNDRFAFDAGLGMVFNYPTWYSRTLANTFKRAIETPGRVALGMKFRAQLRDINADKPEWVKDQVQIGINGRQMWLPLMNMFDPMNAFFGDKFRDPDLANTPYGAFLSEMQQYGPGLHSGIATIMAIDAYRRGETEELQGWMGYLGQWTRALNATSVLAKEAFNIDAIPAGGIGLEPWLWRIQNGQARFIGTKWDAHRIGTAVSEMLDNGDITYEQAYDVMINQEGPIFDAALERSKEMSAPQTVLSWLFGTGLKARPDIEVQVQEMDMATHELMAMRPGSGPNALSPEAYRQQWAALRELYPWMDSVRAFRKDEMTRQEIFSWSVFNRLPPNPEPYFRALGFDDRGVDVYNGLMDTFYEDGGLGSMSELEREQFFNMMKQMGAILAMPDDATQTEWEMARAQRRQMWAYLTGDENTPGKYPDAQNLQDQYYYLLNESGREAAQSFANSNPQLQAYWDEKDKLIAGDPLLARYYASMDTFESVSRDTFEAQQERMHPGLHAALEQYYTMKDVDVDAAYEFLDLHPEMKAYWHAKDEWTLGLDVELRGMTAAVESLAPAWAQLREDAQITAPGQRGVADLIASGMRPLGEFELPENLPDRQVQAALNIEIDAIREADAWGEVFRDLRDMGLDDTLTAFLEFRNTDTVAANRTQLKALLAALGMLREDRPELLAATGTTGTSTRGARVSSRTWTPRSGGGGGRGKVRSSTYGGAKAPTPQSDPALNDKISGLMGQLRESNVMWWSYLRNLGGMLDEDRTAFLTANPDFARKLLEYAAQGVSLQALLAWFADTPPAKSVTKRTSSNKTVTSIYSNPNL